MSLRLLDSARQFYSSSVFVKCVLYYLGTYENRSKRWEITVSALDLTNVKNPTVDDIKRVSSVEALSLYNAWVDGLETKTVVESSVNGFSETVVASEAVVGEGAKKL